MQCRVDGDCEVTPTPAQHRLTVSAMINVLTDAQAPEDIAVQGFAVEGVCSLNHKPMQQPAVYFPACGSYFPFERHRVTPLPGF